MEDALRVEPSFSCTMLIEGLNPCSNGRCSASATSIDFHKEVKISVLILVLMEDALREEMISLLETGNYKS